MQLDDAAQILGAADFFSICDLEQRRMLAFASDRRRLDAGEVLFSAGDVTPGAYVLISGSLTVTDRSANGGAGSSIDIDEPGTAIGELAMIAKHPRRATVTAKTDVELLLVPRETFNKLIQQFPGLAEKAAEKIKSDLGAYVSAVGKARAHFAAKG